MAHEIRDINFDKEVREFNGIVVIDFWAEWCAPCRILGPIFDSVAAKYADNATIKFCKMDVDDNPNTQREFMIMSIPTIMIFKNGQLINELKGLLPEEELAKVIEDALKA